MKTNHSGNRQLRRAAFIFAIIILASTAFIQHVDAQIMPYYAPAFFNPFYGALPPPVPLFMLAPPFYGYPAYYVPTTRTASTLSPTLLSLLLAPATVTTATPVIGVSTAITLATLGVGISSTALATLAATPVPTVTTTTPTIGVATALLLGGGGISTTTLLLLGI